MSYHNISYKMPEQDLAKILQALNTIEEALPFLVSLTDDERRNLYKMGSKSVDFVQDAGVAAESFPQILPQTFNQDEFQTDVKLTTPLIKIKIRVDSLKEKLDDTLMAVGSEAMGSALEVYTYVQAQADRQPGLKSVAEKLKERFKKSKSKDAATKVQN